MKKTLFIISMIMIMISSYVFVQEQKSLDQISWDSGPSTQTMMISLDSVEVEKERMVQILTETADKYEANLELVTNRTINGDYYRFHILYLNYDQSLDYQLVSGRELTVDDMNTDNFIATFETNASNQIGTYQDLFNDDKVYFMPLHAYVKEYALYGRMFVSFLNPDNSELFLTELSNALNVSSESLTDNVDLITLGRDTVQRFQHLNQVILISFILALIYFVMFHSKKISVMKLNGISVMDIYVEMIRPILLVEVITSVAVLLLTFVLIPDIASHLLSELVKTICISMLVAFIVLYILQNFMNLASLIKNRNMQSWTTIASVATKVFMAIVVCSSLGMSGTALSFSHSLKEEISNWEPYLDTVFIDGFYQTENHYCSDFTCFDKDQQGPTFMNAILPYAYYIRNETYGDIQWISLSTNYLDQMQLVDKNGEALYIDDELDHSLLLLPISNPEVDYMSIGLTNDLENLEIGYYDDTRANIFSYDPMYGTDNDYILEAPIIDVKTPANMTNFDYACITNPGVIKIMNYSDPSVKGPVDDLFENMMHLTPHLITYEENFEDMITLSNQLWHSYLPILMVSLIIYLFVLYQITKLYVQTHVKKYAIQYTLGHSFYQSFKSYFMIICATWIVSVIGYFATVVSQTEEFINMQVIDYQMNILTFVPLIVMILIELVLVVISLQLMKRRSLVTYLKGGE